MLMNVFSCGYSSSAPDQCVCSLAYLLRTISAKVQSLYLLLLTFVNPTLMELVYCILVLFAIENFHYFQYLDLFGTIIFTIWDSFLIDSDVK